MHFCLWREVSRRQDLLAVKSEGKYAGVGGGWGGGGRLGACLQGKLATGQTLGPLCPCPARPSRTAARVHSQYCSPPINNSSRLACSCETLFATPWNTTSVSCTCILPQYFPCCHRFGSECLISKTGETAKHRMLNIVSFCAFFFSWKEREGVFPISEFLVFPGIYHRNTRTISSHSPLVVSPKIHFHAAPSRNRTKKICILFRSQWFRSRGYLKILFNFLFCFNMWFGQEKRGHSKNFLCNLRFHERDDGWEVETRRNMIYNNRLS